MSIIVTHSLDDECPGHTLQIMGDRMPTDAMLEFARRVCVAELGDTHACDLDWENCVVMDS